MVKHCMSRYSQSLVDATDPPKPSDPETRIAQYQSWIDSGQLELDQELRIKARIAVLKGMVDSLAGNPTKYIPNPKLKGGMGK